jgi:hypothetical protein
MNVSHWLSLGLQSCSQAPGGNDGKRRCYDEEL